MYSAYKLNEQGDNIQPWGTPFPIWNQSVIPCPVLTLFSWPAYRFLKRQVRWSGIPIFSEFSTVYCDPHSQRLRHSHLHSLTQIVSQCSFISLMWGENIIPSSLERLWGSDGTCDSRSLPFLLLPLPLRHSLVIAHSFSFTRSSPLRPAMPTSPSYRHHEPGRSLYPSHWLPSVHSSLQKFLLSRWFF